MTHLDQSCLDECPNKGSDPRACASCIIQLKDDVERYRERVRHLGGDPDDLCRCATCSEILKLLEDTFGGTDDD